MKRLVVLLFVLMGMPIFAFSQVNNDTVDTEQARLDSIRFKMEMDSIRSALDFRIDSLNRAIDSIYQVAIQEKMEYAKKMQQATMFLPRYKMYQTDNVCILLKLDTRIGKVWMVQYRMGATESVVKPIDYFPKADEDEGWNGRFELYPTRNVYTFIMIDNKNGDAYQVQWETEPKYRFIEKITD